MAKVVRRRKSFPDGVRGKVIVVIDDEPAMRDFMTTALDEKGYEVIAVDNAEEGVDVCRHIPIDLAIVDIFMRGRGGLWAIEQLRECNGNAKIIAMSGGWKTLPPTDVVKAATKVGADRGFTKPIPLNDLYAAVDELIGPPLEINV